MNCLSFEVKILLFFFALTILTTVVLGEHDCCLSDICDETKIKSNIIHSPNMDNREEDHRICGIIKEDKDTMMFRNGRVHPFSICI